MKCPVCKTDMIILELEQVETDYCVSCKGIWLDEGELELLLGGPEAGSKLMTTLKEDVLNKEQHRSCPRCHKKMKKVFFSEKQEVTLDKCRKNHGLWFDAGELQEIVGHAVHGEQTTIVRLLQDMFAFDLKK